MADEDVEIQKVAISFCFGRFATRKLNHVLYVLDPFWKDGPVTYRIREKFLVQDLCGIPRDRRSDILAAFYEYYDSGKYSKKEFEKMWPMGWKEDMRVNCVRFLNCMPLLGESPRTES